MVKTIDTKWGKAVKAVVTVEIFAILGEEDKREMLTEAEATARIRKEMRGRIIFPDSPITLKNIVK
jgi:CRISPR/Cas system CMR subunit Cmr6 (Cas7 group RAMP superfamily)